jgi:hypothetical protein
VLAACVRGGTSELSCTTWLLCKHTVTMEVTVVHGPPPQRAVHNPRSSLEPHSSPARTGLVLGPESPKEVMHSLKLHSVCETGWLYPVLLPTNCPSLGSFCPHVPLKRLPAGLSVCRKAVSANTVATGASAHWPCPHGLLCQCTEAPAAHCGGRYYPHCTDEELMPREGTRTL